MSNPLERHAQHRNDLERMKLAADKAKGTHNHRQKTFGQRTNASTPQANSADTATSDWTERLDSGQIVSVDYRARKGILKSTAGADYTFFLDHCSYGMRKINATDKVKFRPDNWKPQVAIEVAPDNDGVRGINEDDVAFFVEECKKQDQGPIYRMRSILLNQEDWPLFLAALPAKRVQEIVLLLIRLPTFKDQSSNPIHLRVIRSFLHLLTWNGTLSGFENNTQAAQPVFPNLVEGLVSAPSDNVTITDIEPHVNVWLDVAELILLYRRLTETSVDAVADRLIGTAEGILARFGSQIPSTLRKALNQVIRRSSPQTTMFLRSAILPSAEEMSVPTWDPLSPFNSHMLPVITKDSFPTSDAYVVAHCKLLRADNFSKTVNVIGHLCFDIPAFRQSVASIFS